MLGIVPRRPTERGKTTGDRVRCFRPGNCALTTVGWLGTLDASQQGRIGSRPPRPTAPSAAVWTSSASKRGNNRPGRLQEPSPGAGTRPCLSGRGGLVVLISLPIGPQAARESFFEHWADFLILPAVMAFLALRRRGSHGRERAFWSLWIASFGCWLLVRGLMIFAPDRFVGRPPGCHDRRALRRLLSVALPRLVVATTRARGRHLARSAGAAAHFRRDDSDLRAAHVLRFSAGAMAAGGLRLVGVPRCCTT